MKLYHGTGDYSVGELLNTPPRKLPRIYLSKPHFSTSESLDAASLFAMRKSSFESMKSGSLSGVVVEYEMTGTEGKDFKRI